MHNAVILPRITTPLPSLPRFILRWTNEKNLLEAIATTESLLQIIVIARLRVIALPMLSDGRRHHLLRAGMRTKRSSSSRPLGKPCKTSPQECNLRLWHTMCSESDLKLICLKASPRQAITEDLILSALPRKVRLIAPCDNGVS